MTKSGNVNLVFAEFELDPAQRQLSKDGKPVAVSGRCLDLLVYLVENRGRVVTKDELLDNVWAGQFVEENNLTVQMSSLRKVLGENKEGRIFISTIPGRGYSFVQEVSSSASGPEPAAIIRSEPAGGLVPREFGLIGRTDELEEIRRLLAGGKTGLITLTGAGGSGKTRLAEAAAEAFFDVYGDRIFFVSLAEIRDADQFAAAVADELGIALSANVPPLRSIADFAGDKRTLLILDNFEQIISAAADVGSLLKICERLQIIVTSRAPMRIKGEVEINVKPLELPPDSYDLPASELARYPAVQLFIVRAQAARPTLKIDDAFIEAATAICRKLDGLPLAIELAAARVRLLSAEGVLQRLEDSLKLLSGGKGLPARQQTMRAAVQWSYDLLDDEEKQIFRHLSIFVGGFSVDAAEAIAGDDGTYALDAVTSLSENGLLTAKEQPDGGMRLKMLEVVREFAHESLAAGPEREQLASRHAAYFMKLAETAEPELLGSDSDRWIGSLAADHENLKAAIKWALANEPDTAARICGALRYFWGSHCHYGTALELMRSALAGYNGEDRSVRFKLMNGIGQMARNQGDYETARKIYEESLAEALELKEQRQSVVALHGLAAIATRQGDFEAAREYNNEELRICRDMGDETGIALALASLADVALSENKIADARPMIRDSMRIARRTGHRSLLMTNLLNCGLADFAEGRWEKAGKCFSESLEIAQVLGNSTFASCAIDGLGALAAQAGKYEKGAFMAGAAEELRSSVGYQIEPAERAFRDAYVDRSRAAVGEAAFDAAFERGRTLTLTDPLSLLNGDADPSGRLRTAAEIIVESHSYSHIIVEEELEQEPPALPAN